MKLNKYILAVIVSISFTGCYDLDVIPPDRLSDATFWQTEGHVKQGMMGIYNAAKQNYAFGMDCMFDYLGEIANGYSTPFPAIQIGSYATNYAAIQNYWQYLYDVIARANGLITNVTNMETISNDAKDAAIAEARFLRALTYFRLIDLFGDVPYYDETTNVNAEFSTMLKPRSSVNEIRQHIIDDLTFAIGKLTVSWPASDYGRATKGAAYALRGKVYLYNKEWNNAIADFEEIVYNRSNNYGYSLHPDYAALFELYAGSRSPEMIFALQSKADGENYGIGGLQYLSNKTTLRNMANNESVPSNELVDMYEYPDGRPFNWNDIFPGYNEGDEAVRRDYLCIKLNASGIGIESLLNADTAKIDQVYRNRDPRLYINVITPFSQYYGTSTASVPEWKMFVLFNTANGGGTAMEANGYIRNGNGAWITYFWRKFVPKGNLDGYLHEWTQPPFEFPLIRLADVLLMLSEAYNEANQLDKAIIELNKVRERVNMPGLNSGAAWMAVTSKDEMTQRIRKERALELAIEGHRFSDLRRWGIAKDVLHGLPALSIYGSVLYTHSFTDRDMLWPIPMLEREMNPNLDQNPGWGN